MSPWNKVPLWNFGIFSLLGYWHILPPSSFSLLVLFPLEDFGIFSLLNIHPLHQFGIFFPFSNLAFSPSQHIWNFLPLFFLGIFSPLNLCWHLYPPDISLGNIFPPRDSLCQIPSMDYIFSTFSPPGEYIWHILPPKKHFWHILPLERIFGTFSPLKSMFGTISPLGSIFGTFSPLESKFLSLCRFLSTTCFHAVNNIWLQIT